MAKKPIKKRDQTSLSKKAEQLTTKKGFSNVLISDLDKFAALKEKAGDNVTDAEMLALLIKSYSGSDHQDTSKFTEEITTLHDEIQRITKEKDLLTMQITEQQITIDGLKDQIASHSPNQEITDLQTKIQELQAIITEQANSNAGSDDLKKQLESCKQDIETLENDKTELEKQVKELKANKIELTGNQFIADVSDENYQRIDRYKIDLYKKKLISGDSEALPNEVINWAINKALQVTFGKLEV